MYLREKVEIEDSGIYKYLYSSTGRYHLFVW